MLRKTRPHLYSGYTIIETMISISLFLVVVMSGMGALLNANLVHEKSQDMRGIIDSLSFIMEDMARNLRVGYDFHCIDNGDLNTIFAHSCEYGGGISFKSSLADGGGQWIYYIKNDGTIHKRYTDAEGVLHEYQLTPPDVVIDDISGFSVLGAESPSLGNTQQPFITIRLVGKVKYHDVETPFSLQTSTSARLIDL